VRLHSAIKLRSTQLEQMSAALPPRTDVGLAFPKKITPIEGYGISIGKISASCQRRSRQACRNRRLGAQKIEGDITMSNARLP
jgi:hypothetical protein